MEDKKIDELKDTINKTQEKVEKEIWDKPKFEDISINETKSGGNNTVPFEAGAYGLS